MNNIKWMEHGYFEQIQFGLGNEMYITGCYACGKPVKTWVKRNGTIFKCKECRKKEKEKESQLTNEIGRLKVLRRIEKAEELLSKLYGEKILEEYAEGIVHIKENINEKNLFQSTNEVLALIELKRKGVLFEHQVSLGRYRLDFVLPRQKVVLEIDGGFRKQKVVKDRDKIKDMQIVTSLGPAWEIIRISDEVLKKNPRRLATAINAVLKERYRLRKSYKGSIPKRLYDGV